MPFSEKMSSLSRNIINLKNTYLPEAQLADESVSDLSVIVKKKLSCKFYITFIKPTKITLQFLYIKNVYHQLSIYIKAYQYSMRVYITSRCN